MDFIIHAAVLVFGFPFFLVDTFYLCGYVLVESVGNFDISFFRRESAVAHLFKGEDYAVGRYACVGKHIFAQLCGGHGGGFLIAEPFDG